jgi:hypothetical protein
MDEVAVMKAIPIAGTTSPSRHAVTVPGSHTATIPGSHVPAPRAHAGAAGKRSGTVAAPTTSHVTSTTASVTVSDG